MKNRCKPLVGVLVSHADKIHHFLNFCVVSDKTYFSRMLILYMKEQENKIRTKK